MKTAPVVGQPNEMLAGKGGDSGPKVIGKMGCG